MATEFLSSDPNQIARRLSTSLGAARDADGNPLFPDHGRPGTPAYNIKQLLLQEVLQWHREANVALSAMSPITAAGVYLDRWAEFFGTPRGGADYATGEVEITSDVPGEHLHRLLGTRTIPEGTRLVGSDGAAMRLLSTVEVPLEGTSVTAAVQAEQSGPLVRLSANTSLSVEAGKLTSVLSARVVNGIEGGTYAETDEQLRFRLVRALVDPTTFEGYRTQLLAHPDVSEAQLSSGVYGAGTLEAFVVPSIALPTATLRDELENIWRGAGNVFVTFPAFEAVQLQIRLAGDADKSLVVDFINNLNLGEALVLNALETALQNAGASDAQVISIRRGRVGLDGEPAAMRLLKQVTNLSPSTPRSKWHSREEWITFCE